LAGLLQSCKFVTPEKRFETTSKTQFTDLTAKKMKQLVKEDTLRKLRVRIDRGSMAHIEKDKEY
jgi:hypothetical protein